MSDLSLDRPDFDELVALIGRQQAEPRKFAAEQNRLAVETGKLTRDC